jgi:hypothetical protein
MLDLPVTLAAMHASGLMGTEMARVEEMMRDPRWTGALVATLPEELAVEETLELVPRATKSLGRPPLAVLVNRSAARIVAGGARPAWLSALRGAVPAPLVDGLEAVEADLRGRLAFETQLRRELEGATPRGIFALDEQLAFVVDGSPRGVVDALAASFDPAVAGAA